MLLQRHRLDTANAGHIPTTHFVVRWVSYGLLAHLLLDLVVGGEHGDDGVGNH
jgi:hypothetical protein